MSIFDHIRTRPIDRGRGDGVSETMIDDVMRWSAHIRAMGRPIVRIRMHPNDAAWLRARYGMEPASDVLVGVPRWAGVPILEDENRAPGEPEVEYAE